MTLNGLKCIKQQNPLAQREGFQASVTIEAALGLPIFVIVILSIAFWIMALRTQEMIHCSLINAANTMAVQHYLAADLKKVYENTGNTNTGAANPNAAELENNMKYFYYNLEKYNNEVLNDSYDIVKAYIQTGSEHPEIPGEYISQAQSVYESYKSINSAGNPDLIYGDKGMSLFKQYLINEFYKRANASSYGTGAFRPGSPIDTANNTGDDSNPKFNRLQWVNALLDSYSIIGGFNGIEFADNTGANKWASEFQPETDDNYITIKVRYELSLPFPIQTLSVIPMSQCVKVRLWGTGD